MELKIKEIEFGSQEYDAEVLLRDRILRAPLGLKFSVQELLLEKNSIHLGAYLGDKIVGCLLLSPQANQVIKMRQVAVDTSRQGLGIGKKLVQTSEIKSRQLRFTTIELNARETAVPFYLSLGYEILGEPFEEVTLVHRKMRKVLGS